MDRNRMMSGLGFAILVGLFGAIFVYHEFKVASTPPPVVVMKQIVVAAGPLPLGTVLSAKDLRTIPWPNNAPVSNMLRLSERRSVVLPDGEPIAAWRSSGL